MGRGGGGRTPSAQVAVIDTMLLSAVGPSDIFAQVFANLELLPAALTPLGDTAFSFCVFVSSTSTPSDESIMNMLPDARLAVWVLSSVLVGHGASWRCHHRRRYACDSISASAMCSNGINARRRWQLCVVTLWPQEAAAMADAEPLLAAKGLSSRPHLAANLQSRSQDLSCPRLPRSRRISWAGVAFCINAVRLCRCAAHDELSGAIIGRDPMPLPTRHWMGPPKAFVLCRGLALLPPFAAAPPLRVCRLECFYK